MATFQAVVTDINDADGTPVYTFEPWTDGHAVGFKVTRHSDGAVSYVYLNPSTDTWSDGDFHPDVFVYTGAHGDPAQDASHYFYSIDFEERVPCVQCKRLYDPDEMNCPDEGLMCESCFDAKYDG